MRKILIAPDKFKGTASSNDVIQALKAGILSVKPDSEITGIALADGGDGSVNVLSNYFTLEKRIIQVRGPIWDAVFANYAIAGNKAFIEMASSSGLALLDSENLDTKKTTSFGTGELIKDAIEQGATDITLFVGGSATTDGGIGMASALGYSFYDKDDVLLEPIGANLEKIKTIQKPIDDILEGIVFTTVCDVENPLYGTDGAAYVYGPQKGATEKDIQLLDKGLRNLHALILEKFAKDVNVPGAGAAGGFAAGAIAFLGAELTSGIDLFLNYADFESNYKNADVLITGEGRLDRSSFQGKVVGGIINKVNTADKPVIIVCGQAADNLDKVEGVEVKTVLSKAKDTADAMENWKIYLFEIGQEIAKNLHNI